MAASLQAPRPAAKSAQRPEEEAEHDVALFNPGESEHNTIVLGGVNVVIPLERDLDGDPFQDDAVCLRAYSGAWEHVCVSSAPEVVYDEETEHLCYPFRDVPAGIYKVDVRIAERWVNVIARLMVSRGVAYLGDQALEEAPQLPKPTTDDPHRLRKGEGQDDEGESDPCGCGR